MFCRYFWLIFSVNLILWSEVRMSGAAIDHVYACESKIYCQGPILDAVNRFELFSDSKHFVDMSLKFSPEKTLSHFYSRFPDEAEITDFSLREFVNRYFNEPESELEDHYPEDFTADPPAFKGILDSTYKEWASDLNRLWTKLTRKIKEDVKLRPEHYSLIDLPNPFVVPGGRFREIYYWDAYWIIRGLLHCNMLTTAREMIENYFTLIRKLDLVPNGGRVYYSKRSQPPFLTRMVEDYYRASGNKTFVRRSVHLLEHELVQFWRRHRSIVVELNGQQHRVFHYNTETNTPRPESYKEDMQSAKNLPQEDKANLYSNIASAAETGWDFSSRWLADRKNFRLHKTRLVLPVDLNALMCGNFKILADLFGVAGYKLKAAEYYATHAECKNTMMKVFYDEATGVWFDFHLDTLSHSRAFYPSNLSPLFTNCYEFANKTEAMRKILVYLRDSKALENVDGIPTSFIRTGQQWDWPNAWAPLVHMTVEGLRNTGDRALTVVARRMAEHWARHNFKIYNSTKSMFEKYDVANNVIGSGGEYEVQEGFGWTNGVIIDFLVTYGDRLNATKDLPHGHVFDDIATYF